jgi:hypothetical protein
MDAGLSYIAALVQPDTDPRVAFDSGHRLNGYLSCGSRRWFGNRLAHKDPRMTRLVNNTNTLSTKLLQLQGIVTPAKAGVQCS